MGSFRDLAGVLAVFFLGSVVLAPVLAWSLRVALKPIVDTLRYRADPKLLGRMEQMEGEIQELRHTLSRVAETQQFDRSLGPTAVGPGPRPESARD